MRFKIITPSFAPDYERCKLLSEGVKEFVPVNVEHLLLVDRRDVPLFKTLSGPRTRVVAVEEIIPSWIRRIPGIKKWWLSFKTLPVRNWILQQLAKLSVGDAIDAEAYIFIDSDVALIREFDPATFVDTEDRLRLFRVPGAAKFASHARWHRAAANLLGLPSSDYFGSTYIGNLISWRREQLLSLYRRIEAVKGMSWPTAICHQLHLSEYILYGIFAEHIQNGEGHYYSAIPNCHISWDYDISNPLGLGHFFGELKPDHVAVMVSSKQGVPAGAYRNAIETMKASHSAYPLGAG